MYSLVPAAPVHADFSNVPVPAVTTLKHDADAEDADATALTANTTNTHPSSTFNRFVLILICSSCCAWPLGRPPRTRCGAPGPNLFCSLLGHAEDWIGRSGPAPPSYSGDTGPCGPWGPVQETHGRACLGKSL